MDEVHFESAAILRVMLGALATILLFVAGHHLRAASSDPVPQALGLMAYGLACLSLATAIPVTVALTPWSRTKAAPSTEASPAE